jgi:SAM-dependent methyltransferase
LNAVPSLVSRLRLKFTSYGADSDSKKRYWRDRLRAGYFANTNTPVQIAKSEQIVRLVTARCEGLESLHEIGVGGGRNIQHLLRALPDVRYSGNDLDRAAIEPFMAPEVKERLELVEQDTLRFLRDRADAGHQFDAVLTADHLIHIPPDTIRDVLEQLQRCARRWIVLHEGVRRSPSRTDDFWWAHDFAPLLDQFEIVHEEPAELGDEYVLRLYRRR